MLKARTGGIEGKIQRLTIDGADESQTHQAMLETASFTISKRLRQNRTSAIHNHLFHKRLRYQQEKASRKLGFSASRTHARLGGRRL